MLVLSRKPHESIRIGDNIEIVVSAIQGNRVRLGIRAPRSPRILRTEIAGASAQQLKRHVPPLDAPLEAAWEAPSPTQPATAFP